MDYLFIVLYHSVIKDVVRNEYTARVKKPQNIGQKFYVLPFRRIKEYKVKATIKPMKNLRCFALNNLDFLFVARSKNIIDSYISVLL